MKNTAFLKRLLSIATASMLLASACSTLFTASAEPASGTAIQTYQLLDTEDYKAGWNTDGVAQNNLMTDVVSGKTLNRVSANYDLSGEVRVYIDCKTPEVAGFSLDAIHSVAYYFKNDAGKELTVNFQNFTDKPIEGGWLTAFGRLMNCAVYLVPSDGNLVKATASDIYGQVKIPEDFEGYVVYDTDTRTTESSNEYVCDLLNGSYTFGSAMAFTIPDGILKGGDVFYYGEISASTGTAKEFISSVNSAAVYRYPLVTGVSWGLENITVDETDPDNKIFTGNMPTGRNESGFDQIGFFNKNIATDYGTNPSEITACSFYVKNPGGHGTVNLRLGKMDGDVWNFFDWTYWDYYDINTGSFTRNYSEVITVPAGFEGYVVLDVRQTAEGNPNSKYADIFNGGTLWFHEKQDASVGGLKISIGSVTAWTGNYQNVKQALVEKSNVLPAPMSQGYDGNANITASVISGVSQDGDCRQFKSNGNATDLYNMWFDLSKSQLGSQAVSSEFISKNEALGVWFKNASANAITIGMSESNKYPSVKLSYRLFDTKKLTVTEPTSGDISVPAGFEGYIFILLDTTTANGMSWAEYAANGGNVEALYLSASVKGLANGESYYIGDLGYVRSVDEFIESRLEVTLEGDANKDGSADILDLVRLKKNAAGISEATVYVPNISYGGNNDTTAATTVSNLRKQLLGADYQPAAVSQEVHDRLVPPAQETVEADTVPVAASSVGVSIYHMTPGDWDKVYGSEKAESDFINNYPGNDISDVRTAKERGAAAWIGISGAYFDEPDGDQNARANLDKYVNTLKAEKLWNTVAGFEFEEITGASENNEGKLAQFKELSEYLYTKYPEKRQFAVLAVAEVHHATTDAYKYVTDIAFDWYQPTEIEKMRALFEEMKTNTGLTNAKYWFLPGAYTDLEPSAETAAHALTQLNICYELLMEQPASNRGGLYLYNWQTFSNENGTAYGLDELLKKKYYAGVKARIFEVADALMFKITVVNEGTSTDGHLDDLTTKDFNYNSNFNGLDLNAQETFSYYIKNNSSMEINGQMWFDYWGSIDAANVKTYNINTGEVKAVGAWQNQFKVPAGFEGYVVYDLRDKASSLEILKNNYPRYQYDNTWSFEIKDVAFSNSFEMADAYFKSLIKNIVVNDGTNGNTGWVWTEYNNGTAASSRNYTTVDGVSPDGTALKLSYTEEEIATIENAGWAEGGINTNFTANRDFLLSATMLSYYVKLDNGTDFNVKFEIRPYKSINAPVTVYNLKTKELTSYAAGESIKFTEFEGYVMFDLRSASVDWSVNEVPYSNSWKYYAANNEITSFQFDLSANSLVNRSLVIDSVTFSTDYNAQLNAIMAK